MTLTRRKYYRQEVTYFCCVNKLCPLKEENICINAHRGVLFFFVVVVVFFFFCVCVFFRTKYVSAFDYRIYPKYLDRYA